MNFGHSDRPLNNLLNNLLSSNNFLNNGLNRNNLFSLYNDFFNSFTYIRNLFEYLLNPLINNYPLFKPDDFLNPNFLYSLSYYLLDHLRHLNYSLDSLCDRDDFLDDLLDWNRDLNWDNDLSLHWIGLTNLHRVIDWPFHLYHLRDLPDNFNDPLNHHLIIDDSLFVFWHLYDFIVVGFYLLLNIDVDILHCLNLHDSLLDHRYLDDPFNLFDLFLDDGFLDDPFDDLRDLDYFLHNSRNDNDSFDDLLYFDNFGNLDHLLNNLFYGDSNLFDSIHVSDHLNDFLLDVFDWLGNFDVMIDDFLHLDNPWLSDYLRLSNIHFLYDGLFQSLNYWLFNDLYDPENLFVEHRDLDYPLNLLDNLGDCENGSINEYLYFPDPVLVHNFLPDNWDFIGLLNDGIGLDYPLNDLRDFDYFLHSLDDGDGLLNDPVNNLVPDFDVVLDLFGIPVLNATDHLLDNPLHLDDLRYLDNPLHYFLHNHRHLHNLLNDLLLARNDHLPDHFHLPYLVLDVIDYPLYLDNPLYLNDPVHQLLHSHYLWHLFGHLDNSLDYLGHLNYPLYYPLHLDYLLHDVRHYHWHLHWYMDS